MVVVVVPAPVGVGHRYGQASRISFLLGPLRRSWESVNCDDDTGRTSNSEV